MESEITYYITILNRILGKILTLDTINIIAAMVGEESYSYRVMANQKFTIYTDHRQVITDADWRLTSAKPITNPTIIISYQDLKISLCEIYKSLMINNQVNCLCRCTQDNIILGKTLNTSSKMPTVMIIRNASRFGVKYTLYIFCPLC